MMTPPSFQNNFETPLNSNLIEGDVNINRN